jgi:hypothetical protein
MGFMTYSLGSVSFDEALALAREGTVTRDTPEFSFVLTVKTNSTRCLRSRASSVIE